MVGKKYLQYTAVALHTASAAAQTIKAGGETIRKLPCLCLIFLGGNLSISSTFANLYCLILF